MEVLLFGITRDIVGSDKISIASEESPETVAHLKEWLEQRYGGLSALRSLAVAVDNEYADDSTALTSSMEVALIPPVSGG
ncbi:molybdopterin synthase sulfur carrier subunit [Arcticibacter tournemirensis]|uniref:Molybdopterin synthase sulfur carrier subunit n=1 Tax=Arcticibacter tournemirensis TaxID=699437 RepID=A0A5M9HGF4_9SPHI|nr:molybdopterin converting factor subunit 1 [Arcticibacter tournemirensis]KAA8485860.1 molybdopterin converting factor subunit 1 [Arcticibacter tournemirensis]TQM46890.1 molybdopterin synthase sulfur carrier subunit [Arcticibacter tournemirensis]